MNEVIKAMKERRSIRKFKAEMPPKRRSGTDRRGWFVCRQWQGQTGSDHYCSDG